MLQTTPRTAIPQTRKRRVWRILGIAFLLSIVAGAGVVYFASPTWLHQLVSDKGSDKLGRKFSIDGDIHINWDWREPTIELNHVRLDNLETLPDPYMVDIDRLNFKIKIWKLLTGQLNLPVVEAFNPKIILEKPDDKTKNWDFPVLSKANAATRAALPTDRSNFPIIGLLTIHQGKLTYRDKTLGLDTTLEIDTINGSSTNAMKLRGTGVLHEQKFNLSADGGSLDMLRESKFEYPLNIAINMGKTEIKVNGVFHDPVNMQGIDARVDIQGDNLADIFYITGIPLPPSPVYSFGGQLRENKEVWTFDDLKGRLGESDIGGNVRYDTSGERNYMQADIVSHLLRMEDLGGFIGAKTGSQPAHPSDKLIPDVPLNVTRFRSADMDVDFKATKINQPGWPIENMNLHFHLKDGVLRIDPLSFGVAQGKISGPLTLDGQSEVPVLETDILLEGLSLKPFFDGGSFASLSEGHFGGRVQVKGTGKSLADVMATSNGRIALMMAGGTISKLIADAAGLDVKVAGELLGKDEKTVMRCAIADFGVKEGSLKSETFVLDTTASKIDGDMKINFKDQTIDGKIQGHPKEATISGQIPITVSGPLRKPDIGIGARETAVRGGIAAALSILTPIAAIIPFINLDIEKDSNCAALINAASDKSGVEPKDVTAPQK